jgi:hypothetical protein
MSVPFGVLFWVFTCGLIVGMFIMVIATLRQKH